MIQSIGRAVARPARETLEPVSTPIAGNFAENYPALQDFLEQKRGSHKRHRTGSATLFVDGGRYKLCLNDRPRSRSCFVSAKTLGKLYETANIGLEHDLLEWRTKGYKEPK